MQMQTNSSRGLYRGLVQELGAEIVTGAIAPGARVDVDALERKLRRQPDGRARGDPRARHQGLVDARPKRGTYVLERDHWNMLDIDVITWRYGGRPDAQFLRNLHEVRLIIEPAVHDWLPSVARRATSSASTRRCSRSPRSRISSPP